MNLVPGHEFLVFDSVRQLRYLHSPSNNVFLLLAVSGIELCHELQVVLA